MITTAEQYNANLHILYNNNPPSYVALPKPEYTYNIDIKTREIDAPRFLAVEKDNISETIYFIIDRYADYMDLATTNCVVTYTNAENKTRQYLVPFYDIYTYSRLKKMIIPWCLSADVTKVPGEVEFAIQFFKVEESDSLDQNDRTSILSYSLNTLPAKSKVLAGIKEKFPSSGYKINASEYEELIGKINDINAHINNENINSIIYWTTLE
jgi:hypothetical protein